MSEQSRIQDLETELEQTQASLAQRFEELGQVTRQLIDIEHERDQLRQQLQAVTQAVEWFQATPPTAVAAPEGEGAAQGDEVTQAEQNEPEPFVPVQLEQPERKALEQYLDVVRESELFDAEWYLEHYSDVKDSKLGRDPAKHYLCFGGFEGRHPGPNFDSVAYYRQYPDVHEGRFNPLLHYLLHGQQEERQVFPL